MIRVAISDGVVCKEESEAIRHYRRVNRITDEQHEEVLARVGWTGGGL